MQKIRLKKKRYDAAAQGKLLHGRPIRVSSKLLSRLSNYAQKQVEMMNSDVEGAIMDFIHNGQYDYATDASLVSQLTMIIRQRGNYWRRHFAAFSKLFADEMTENVRNDTRRDVGYSLQYLAGGTTIDVSNMSKRSKEILKAASYESASLMVTLQQGYMSGVQQAVNRSISTNQGGLQGLIGDIHNALRGKYKTYKNKAKNNALDQTRKVYNNLAASRMQDAGVKKFIWHHTNASKKPRSYHRDVLDGQVYSFDNLPIIDPKTGERGIPGQAINCHCYMEPVIEF